MRDQLRAAQQQLVELLHRALSDAREHIPEPGERSTFTNPHDATKLRTTSIVLPPRSLPPTTLPRKLIRAFRRSLKMCI
jgi:hypothetical protein